jgi:hypothetical protein
MLHHLPAAPVQLAPQTARKQNIGDKTMPLDAAPPGQPGGGASCKACRQPIWPGEPTTHVEFQNDPSGALGLTGIYHRPCGKRFLSLARVINMNPWSRS